MSSFGQKTNEIISRISALASIGQKSWKKLRWFFVQTMIPKRHFEINWPLVYSTCHLQGPLLKKFEFPTNSDQLTKHNKTIWIIPSSPSSRFLTKKWFQITGALQVEKYLKDGLVEFATVCFKSEVIPTQDKNQPKAYNLGFIIFCLPEILHTYHIT